LIADGISSQKSIELRQIDTIRVALQDAVVLIAHVVEKSVHTAESISVAKDGWR
jgi:hypothetical protein